ncbi:dihydroorotate dehydrogenase [Nonomuraea soli]|uniref:Dihydroorotate dehydrogenase n=1 Tax=Nonomuraea soli TaxID=1032476 RepID=A0A7W0HPZ0_9ACTN|nr:dihydroorotate dehydrogenase [Nonomuraea soli]MBA2891262.1 dihydroorotate dehydrogenase (NAD+) catalytic subunit [Nonomuraea soli]
MRRTAVRLGRLDLCSPVMPASGCFGPELRTVTAMDRLGAVVTKTVFSDLRSGNPASRLAETRAGMLNAVGIPSPGLTGFRERTLPAYRALGPKVIVSIGGLAVRDYLEVAAGLADEEFAAFEVNVSCPNLEHGGLDIGTDPRAIEAITRGVRERGGDRPVIVKMTPNVTSVAEIARAAEDAGAEALTVANTFVGLAVDLDSRRPLLGNVTGGMSGAAIKPLALRLVMQASRAVRIPVIGCGGIGSVRDAAEFLVAGARAVQVGTANFTRPTVMSEIVEAFPALLDRLGARDVDDLVGTLATA